MDAVEELKREHSVIEGVLASLERRLEEFKASGRIEPAYIRGLVKFCQTFIDKCHHGKEERCLFPCFERLGIPREGGPIGVMLQEHEMGRMLVRRISDMLELYEQGAAELDDILDTCQMYVELLKQHIYKENNILFPMGGGLMGSEDHKNSMACYEEREHELGHDTHQRMLELAKKLSE